MPQKLRKARRGIYVRWGKRCLDIVLSATALVICAPLIGLVAVVVRLRLGSPVLFRQIRIGRNERAFTILKFRSMTNKHDASGRLLRDTMRLTRLGRFLRASSLDELPELFNVLRGEMSLVGPRPLLPRYQPWYTPQERKRFEVLPGITGWAQVSGRNALSWDARFQCDIQYVEKCSLALDLQLLLRTVGKVLRRENVQVDTSATLRSLDDERRALRGNPAARGGHMRTIARTQQP